MEKIVLASGSPRRKELLARTGVDFSVVVSNGEEKTNLTDPAETVEKLSQDKAISVADRLENESEPCLIIGADTVVAFEGKILGKPSDEEDALDTLLKLQGKSHQVYTGVTLLVKEQGIWKPYTFSERTDVEFYPVSREELLEYIKTGEPMDKAGSYGIQGKFGIYVKGICGDYNNVVGLPVGRLVYEVVRKYGLKPMPIENYRYYCGNGADMLVKRLLVDAGDPELLHYEEARALYRKEFDKDPFYKIQHYPGMPETLKELKKRGVKLGVCSNKPHEAAVKVVERMFGSQIFDAVMGQSDSVRKKPAPDGPLKIAEQFGIKPEECMYLGDSGTDMQTGKAAGMYTVGVLWGYREKEELLKNGADYLVDSPEDILDLYEEKCEE